MGNIKLLGQKHNGAAVIIRIIPAGKEWSQSQSDINHEGFV